jgi:hypothetical protein
MPGCDVKRLFLLPHVTRPAQLYQYDVRFESFTAVTMKNAIFCYKNPVRTSQETHYISATEPVRLMICKI